MRYVLLFIIYILLLTFIFKEEYKGIDDTIIEILIIHGSLAFLSLIVFTFIYFW